MSGGPPETPEPVRGDNSASREAWSGSSFERFLRFRHLVSAGLRPQEEQILAAAAPAAGDRVADLGCGFGETTARLGRLVGAGGAAVGIDISQPFVDLAAREAAEAGLSQCSFVCGDVQEADLGGPYDFAFSRMGLMFFADPARAYDNILAAIAPGAPLAAAVWRRKRDNDWIGLAERVVARHGGAPDPDPAGPGPFGLTDADRLTDLLTGAGFERVALRRFDSPMLIGRDLEEAVEYALRSSSVSSVLEDLGPRVDRAELARELRGELAPLARPDGVFAPSSSWILSARAPG